MDDSDVVVLLHICCLLAIVGMEHLLWIISTFMTQSFIENTDEIGMTSWCDKILGISSWSAFSKV